MKSTEVGTRMQKQGGFNSVWASARFSLGPAHVSQRWLPWLISPKSALPETLASVLLVAAFKWGFGWEQYQRDRHYTPILMKLMGSKSFWLKALTGWDHTGLQNHCFPGKSGYKGELELGGRVRRRVKEECFSSNSLYFMLEWEARHTHERLIIYRKSDALAEFPTPWERGELGINEVFCKMKEALWKNAKTNGCTA